MDETGANIAISEKVNSSFSRNKWSWSMGLGAMEEVAQSSSEEKSSSLAIFVCLVSRVKEARNVVEWWN